MNMHVSIGLLVGALVLGTAGYLLAGTPFYESLIGSLTLLTMRAPMSPSNALIEIARWLGVLFTLNVVFTIIATAVAATADDLRIRRLARKPDAAAVHGDGLFADKLAEQMPTPTIRSDKPGSFRAPVQVLMYSEGSLALDFYSAHEGELASAGAVYIALDDIVPDADWGRNALEVDMARVCAQQYWERWPVFESGRIAVIGSGSYAESLLSQGLLSNIPSVEGGVEYVVIGDFGKFRNLHPMLDDALSVNADSIEFLEGPWHEHVGCLGQCDRLILCGESGQNIRTASDLAGLGVAADVHVRCDSQLEADVLARAGIEAFGTAEQLCTDAVVVRQRQHDAGKISAIAYRLGTASCDSCRLQARFPEATVDGLVGEDVAQLRYRRLAAVDLSTCLRCAGFEDEWHGLDEFTRQSNYAVAAHDVHKARLLEMHGAGPQSGVSFSALPQAVRDELQEIEHIRWCRFHYLNNWRYGPAKDKVAREHPCLVPYASLPRQYKDYDGDAYETLWLRAKGTLPEM